MSYLVLARKYRPQNFDEVVGQQPIVRTLRNALSRDRVSHAMIFSGVRGVGKTTLARIMAKAMNCKTDSGERPCNLCDSCKQITAGSALDLHEIDGASNRGIQEIRELKENIRFLPTTSRFKVIIIDEVHMLTTEAFNALLKTLEEPPEHVAFMFATTELHKIPVTILSRCQRYELKRIPFEDLTKFFTRIAEAEKVTISPSALEMIAREAEGSVRDGLSLLDQIFSFGGDTMTDADVREVLGLVDRQVYDNLAAALLSGDLAGAMEILDNVYGIGIDLKRFTADLLHYFRALLVCRKTPAPEKILDVSDRELTTLKEIAAKYSAEHLSRFFDLLIKGVEEMQYSSQPRLVLEMTFIKALQTGEVVGVADILSRLDRLTAGIETEPVMPAASQVSQAPQTPAMQTISTAEPEPRPAPTQPQEPESESDKKKIESSGPAISPSPARTTESHTKDVRRNWAEFIAYVKDRKPWMAQVINLCESVREEGEDLVLRFDDPRDAKVLQQPDNLKLLIEFAQDFFQREFDVLVSVPGGAGEGPHEDDGPREERRALAGDPLVELTAEIFGGQVSGIRTGPRSR